MKQQVGPHETSTTLYVTDLDGTLLRDDATVSPRSIELINSAISRGAFFTYATARSFTSSRRVTAELELRLPVITYGGTVLAHQETGQAHEVQLLPRAIVEAAMEACTAAGLQPILHTFDDGRDRLRWHHHAETEGTRAFVAPRVGDARIAPITEHDPPDLDAVFYVAVLGLRHELVALRDSMQPTLAECAHFISHDPATEPYHWLEFHTWEGAKSAAIRRLMNTVGANRLVVFGNNHNDLPMFEIADEAYAVAEAIPEVLAAATTVIGSNNADAVAEWIDAHAAR